jgi:hypothetical protein
MIAALVYLAKLTGLFYGWLLLLLFGILHLHVSGSVPAIGWWTAWPIGFIYFWLRSYVPPTTS